MLVVLVTYFLSIVDTSVFKRYRYQLSTHIFRLLIFFLKNECSDFHKRVFIESSLLLLCACIPTGLLLLTPLCTAFEKVFGEVFDQ